MVHIMWSYCMVHMMWSYCMVQSEIPDEEANGKRPKIKCKFYTGPRPQAKRIWKNAVEQHVFFQWVTVLCVLILFTLPLPPPSLFPLTLSLSHTPISLSPFLPPLPPLSLMSCSLDSTKTPTIISNFFVRSSMRYSFKKTLPSAKKDPEPLHDLKDRPRKVIPRDLPKVGYKLN